MAILPLPVHISLFGRRRQTTSSSRRVVSAGHRIHVQVRGIHSHQRRRDHQSIRAGEYCYYARYYCVANVSTYSVYLI